MLETGNQNFRLISLRFYNNDGHVWLRCTHASHNPTHAPQWRISSNCSEETGAKVQQAIQHTLDEHAGGDI